MLVARYDGGDGQVVLVAAKYDGRSGLVAKDGNNGSAGGQVWL